MTVRRESKEALALMMTGAGISIVPSQIQLEPGYVIAVDVVCLALTENESAGRLRPLAIICEDALLIRMTNPLEEA